MSAMRSLSCVPRFLSLNALPKAIRFNANNVHAYKNRGLAKRAKGDSAGSDVDIAMAKQLNQSAGN